MVSGIVSLKRWKCVATGFANHAGTTPMNRRKEVLAAVAKHLLFVRDVVRAETGTQVGTVGYMKAEPGAPNVIPGRVEFPVELRDLDAGKIERMWRRIQEKFAEADKEEGVETRCEVVNESRLHRATRRSRASSAKPRSRPASRPWICRAVPCTTPEKYRGLRRWA